MVLCARLFLELIFARGFCCLSSCEVLDVVFFFYIVSYWFFTSMIFYVRLYKYLCSHFGFPSLRMAKEKKKAIWVLAPE